MKTALVLCFMLLAPIHAMAEASGSINQRTLLYVHVLGDGSLGEMQILSSGGDDALAICMTKKMWALQKSHSHKAFVDHWEKRSIVLDMAPGKPMTCQ